MIHGYIPDLLIENDAPVCEVCHGSPQDHDGDALITQEYDRLREELAKAQAIIARTETPGLIDQLVKERGFLLANVKLWAALAIDNNWDTNPLTDIGMAIAEAHVLIDEASA